MNRPVSSGNEIPKHDDWMVRVRLDGEGEDPADRYHVRLHGRLFDRAALIRELSCRDDSSDADIIALAFERWGSEAPQRLKGVYCIVATNRARDFVVIVRDRTGICPVFWATSSQEIFIATSLQPLKLEPKIQTRPDRTVIAASLSDISCSPQDTWFTGIQRLPAGHTLTFRRGRQALSRYWTPDDQVRDLGWVQDDEIARFDDLLEQAILRCTPNLRSAVTLSGGLDSASIAAFGCDIARNQNHPLPTALSLIFPHPECNEEFVQRGIAKQLGVRQNLFQFEEAVGPGGLLASALEVTRNWPGPLNNIWYPAYRTLYDYAAAHGIKDIMTGNGGDEWLNVTPDYAADLIASGDVRGLTRLIRHYRHSFSVPGPAMLRNVLWRYGLRAILSEQCRNLLRRGAPSLLSYRRRGRLWRKIPKWVCDSEGIVSDIMDREPKDSDVDLKGPYKYYFRDAGRIFAHPYLSMEMEDYYEAGKRSGVSILHPYWDADLVEFLYRVPPDVLYKNGRTKSLVRDRLALRFSGLGFEHQKKVLALNFITPTIRSQSPPLWDKIRSLTALADFGIVDPQMAENEITVSLKNGNTRSVYMIWILMNMETWLRENG